MVIVMFVVRSLHMVVLVLVMGMLVLRSLRTARISLLYHRTI